MNKYNFFGLGIINGAVLLGERQTLITYSNDEKKSIGGAFDKKLKSVQKIAFLRGFFVFLGYFIAFFEAMDLSLILLNQDLLSKAVQHKLKVRKKLLWFYALVLLVSLFSFVAMPLGLYFVVRLIKNPLGANLIMSAVRGLAILSFVLLLRCFRIGRDVFRFNAAINKVNNAMKSESKLNYQKVHKAKCTSVYSAANFIFVALAICFIGVPFFSFGIHFVLDILIKVAVAFCFICITYEIMFNLEKVYNKNKLCWALAIPFLLTSRLVVMKCKTKHIDNVLYGYEELIQMTITQKDFDKNKEGYRTVYTHIKSSLFDAGITDAREADYLICDTLGLDFTQLYLKDSFSKQETSKLNRVLKERVAGKPLCKIVNKKNFYGRDFFVNEKVLSPRQETEILTEFVVNDIGDKKAKVLDLCTGSGAIGITVALETKAKVIASDKSKAAIDIAAKNAKNLSAKVQFIQSDMFKNLKDCGTFDIIVTNPPYIATSVIKTLDQEVRNYDPIMALDGGEDGLDFYKIIAKKAPDFLSSNGKLYMEIGYDQGESVRKLLEGHFTHIEVIKDYDGQDRIVIAKKG